VTHVVDLVGPDDVGAHLQVAAGGSLGQLLRRRHLRVGGVDRLQDEERRRGPEVVIRVGGGDRLAGGGGGHGGDVAVEVGLGLVGDHARRGVQPGLARVEQLVVVGVAADVLGFEVVAGVAGGAGVIDGGGVRRLGVARVGDGVGPGRGGAAGEEAGVVGVVGVLGRRGVRRTARVDVLLHGDSPRVAAPPAAAPPPTA